MDPRSIGIISGHVHVIIKKRDNRLGSQKHIETLNCITMDYMAMECFIVGIAGDDYELKDLKENQLIFKACNF